MSKPRRRGGLSSSGTSSSTGGGGIGSNSIVTNSCSTVVGNELTTHDDTANSGTMSSSIALLASSTSASLVVTNTSSFLTGGSSSNTSTAVGRAPRSKVSSNVKRPEYDDADHYEETSVTNTTSTSVITAKGGRKKKRAKRGGSSKEDRFPATEPTLLTTNATATSSSAVGRPKGGTTASSSYENASPTPAATGTASSSRAIHRKATTNKASNTTASAATKRGLTSGLTATSATGAKEEHRASSTAHATNNSTSSAISPICVDPGSLTRGMTARKIGHCVASMVRGLNSQQVQADLELMDAYTEACRVYSQKYFAYQNPDLCRIVDDKSATVEYVGIQQLYATTNSPTSSDATSIPTVSNIINTDNAPIEPTTSPSSTQPNIISSPTSHQQLQQVQQQQQQQQQQRARWLYGAQHVMPTRIDPEEEKRIAALRQVISTKEKQREELEAQYISLRANYIRELQLLQASKHENKVSLQLLQQLCYKRAKVLAFKRIRCQIFTDLLACLLYRRATIEEVEHTIQTRSMEQQNILVKPIATTTPNVNRFDNEKKSNSVMNAENDAFITATTNHADATIGNSMDKDIIMEDVVDEKEEEVKAQLVPKLDSKETMEELYKVWDLIESELNKAELDCTDLDIPDDILGNAILAQLIRNPPLNTYNSKAAVIAVEKDAEKGTSSIPSNGGIGKDMNKSSMDIDTSTNSAKLDKRKYRRRALSCGSVDDTGGIESSTKKNNTNPSKEDDVVAPPKVTTTFPSASAPSLTLPLSINTAELAIPWRSLTIPRTPRGVPLYISQLSSYPDKVAGASYGGFLGNKSMDMRYLLPLHRIHGCDNSAYGLPGSLHSKEIELQEMEQLELEISHLEASIREECQRNDKLQSLAIERKRKSDEICTAMMLLRSETENVLLRHNIILNSKEARLRSWEVVKEGRKDDTSSTNPSQVSDNHEEEEEEQEEEMIEEEEEEDFDGQAELESCEAGAEEEEEDEGQAPEGEDDLDESELENSGYENEMDKDEVGNTDVDDEVEGGEEGSSVDGEEEEDDEDEEEDDASAPAANRSRRIVIRAKASRPEASESEEDLEEEEDTDVDTGGDDDQISGIEGEINPSGDDDYSEDDEVDCNDEGVDSIGEEEPKSGSTSSEISGDNSNNGENTADEEDAGSEIDGEQMGDDEYESSEQFDIKEI